MPEKENMEVKNCREKNLKMGKCQVKILVSLKTRKKLKKENQTLTDQIASESKSFIEFFVSAEICVKIRIAQPSCVVKI